MLANWTYQPVIKNKKKLPNHWDSIPYTLKKFESYLVPPARQNDFRTFCMSDETEKVYHELEDVIGVY